MLVPCSVTGIDSRLQVSELRILCILHSPTVCLSSPLLPKPSLLDGTWAISPLRSRHLPSMILTRFAPFASFRPFLTAGASFVGPLSLRFAHAAAHILCLPHPTVDRLSGILPSALSSWGLRPASRAHSPTAARPSPPLDSGPLHETVNRSYGSALCAVVLFSPSIPGRLASARWMILAIPIGQLRPLRCLYSLRSHMASQTIAARRAATGLFIGWLARRGLPPRSGIISAEVAINQRNEP